MRYSIVQFSAIGKGGAQMHEIRVVLLLSVEKTTPSHFITIVHSYMWLQVVGCDWRLGSNATLDRCGICHGDGSSCKTVKDQFKGQQGPEGQGYVEAGVIPAGMYMYNHIYIHMRKTYE